MVTISETKKPGESVWFVCFQDQPREGRRVSVHKAKEPEKQKIEGPTHKIVDKPSNQSLVEGRISLVLMLLRV